MIRPTWLHIEHRSHLIRSIDLRVTSANCTSERAIPTVISGLIAPNREVTWPGRHFGLWLRTVGGWSSRLTLGRCRLFSRPWL